MKLAKDYNSVMGRSADIMKASLGLDFNDFESGSVAFDYEGLMEATGYTIEEIVSCDLGAEEAQLPLTCVVKTEDGEAKIIYNFDEQSLEYVDLAE
jgi:hypothetical protein